jgi:hypothetical protein
MRRLVLALLAALAVRSQARGADSPDVAFLRTLFSTPNTDASLFDEAFTQRVPVSDVQTLVDGYRQRLGGLKKVKHDPTGDQLWFANGSLRATVELDARGKVAGLRFHDEQSAADRAALERVLRTEHADPDWFSHGFLDQISTPQLDQQTAQLRSTEGAFVRIDSRSGVYYAVFANAENIVQIETTASGKIAYLRFSPGAPRSNGA